MREAIAAFLLGFPALFSIVNPISGAFIFREVTAHRSPANRAVLARQVATYSLVVMVIALWAGSFVLAFFGITLGGVTCRRRPGGSHERVGSAQHPREA